MSWDHIFSSLNQYFGNLRRESPAVGDPSQSYRMMSRVITPQELEGLIAVLQLVRKVCEQVRHVCVSWWNKHCGLYAFKRQKSNKPLGFSLVTSYLKHCLSFFCVISLTSLKQTNVVQFSSKLLVALPILLLLP